MNFSVLEFSLKPGNNFERLKIWLTMNEIESGENLTLGFELKNLEKYGYAVFCKFFWKCKIQIFFWFFLDPKYDEPELFLAFGLEKDELNIKISFENCSATAFFEKENKVDPKTLEFDCKNFFNTENEKIFNFEILVENLDGIATIKIVSF